MHTILLFSQLLYSYLTGGAIGLFVGPDLGTSRLGGGVGLLPLPVDDDEEEAEDKPPPLSSS